VGDGSGRGAGRRRSESSPAWRSTARRDYQRAPFERDSLAARDRYDRDRSWAIGLGSAAVVAAGVGLWLWWQSQ
jgi:hypothetical protein